MQFCLARTYMNLLVPLDLDLTTFEHGISDVWILTSVCPLILPNWFLPGQDSYESPSPTCSSVTTPQCRLRSIALSWPTNPFRMNPPADPLTPFTWISHHCRAVVWLLLNAASQLTHQPLSHKSLSATKPLVWPTRLYLSFGPCPADPVPFVSGLCH